MILRQLVFETADRRGDDDPGLEVVALNDVAAPDNLAYLMNHDSIHGGPPTRARASADELMWGSYTMTMLGISDRAELPWRDLEVDLVIDACDDADDRERASRHLEAGAERVIATNVVNDADVTICMGVNEARFDPARHRVISSAGSAASCLAVIADIVDEEFGIESGIVTAIQAYTSANALLDTPDELWRRGRSATLSIVPTTIELTEEMVRIIPDLRDRLDAVAMRVPVPCGSIIDLVVHTEQPTSARRVNDAFRSAARTERLSDILDVTEDPPVSTDIIGTSYSAVVDAESTVVVKTHTVKVLAWHDNEWAYASRIIDLARHVGQQASR
ncbi:MAG: type I glyceraldehyde-3-phosphate dehydrogenase [Gemmatimonadetes bacterium]|nr:type I glyceraldehyde-3-phosphate dehydrogenase [Gemmatimonadota bacterium]